MSTVNTVARNGGGTVIAGNSGELSLGSYTIPANTYGASGNKNINFKSWGYIVNNSGSNKTATLKVYVKGVAQFASVTVTIPSNANGRAVKWEVDFSFGDSITGLATNGFVWITAQANIGGLGTDAFTRAQLQTGEIGDSGEISGIDFTANQLIDVTLQLSGGVSTDYYVQEYSRYVEE